MSGDEGPSPLEVKKVIFTNTHPGLTDFWTTFAAPFGSAPTHRSIHFACTAANGAASEEDAADKIQLALAGDPPYEPFERPMGLSGGWPLLDGVYAGDCIMQAETMQKVLNLLGIASSTSVVCASKHTDTDVSTIDKRRARDGSGHQWEYLMMIFDDTPNAFEGCCIVSNHWYAVFPVAKASSALDMLRLLPCIQQWCTTINDVQPGPYVTTWIVDQRYEDEEKP